MVLTKETTLPVGDYMSDWRAYERAMFNQLYYDFRPPRFVVRPSAREVVGEKSQSKRQLDVSVFDAYDLSQPILVVECKRYSRKLNIKDVEEFIGMLQDLGDPKDVLVCPLGFSGPATRRAKAAGIETVVLTLPDADRLNWREVARIVFPWEGESHRLMGDAYYAFNSSEYVWRWIDALEELPYEEWKSQVLSYKQIDEQKWERMLRLIAQVHPDSGWRYNATQLLDESGRLGEMLCETMLQFESDAEIRELLQAVLQFDT